MRRIVVVLVIAMSLMLSACKAEKDNYEDYRIASIGIEIESDNPYGLRNMVWPDYYDVGDLGHIKMEGVSEDISVKDKNYLISYIDSLPYYDEDKEPLCTITLVLSDYGHGGRVESAYIYDENNAPMEVMFYDEAGEMTTLMAGPIPPMQGFFVKISADTNVYFLPYRR